MRFAFRLLPAALVLPLVPSLAQANELMRAYDLAVQNDATYRAAQFERDAAVEAKPQARAALLPQLEANYNYGYVDTTGSVEQPEVDPDTGEVVNVSRAIDNNGTDETLSVTLTQTLFSVESWRRLQQADSQVAVAEAALRSESQNLMLRTAEAYFGVLGALDSLRSSQAEKAAVERQLEQAKRRFDVGLSAITDVQEAQARYDLTVATELEAQQALSFAREALSEITKAPADGVALLREEIPLPAPNPNSADAWVDAAKQGNLALMIAQLNFNVAERAAQAAKAAHLPTLGAQGTYQDNTSESGSFPQDTQSTAAYVGVRLPLFAGGATQSRVRQAVATREQRDSQREAQARNVERNARNSYQAVITGASRVNALNQAVKSSATALEASETGLEVGTRTAVDVLNAQQQFYLAQRNYFQSRYDYLLNVLRLKAVAGRLGSADLNEVDKLLVEG